MPQTQLGIVYPAKSDAVRPASNDFRTLAATADAAIVDARWTRSTITTGTDLNNLTTPGVYPSPSYAVTMSLENRPPMISQPMTVRVHKAGNTVFQVAEGWDSSGSIVMARETHGGVFRRWRLVSGGSGASSLDAKRLSVFGDSQADPSVSGQWTTAAAAALPGVNLDSKARSGDSSNEVLIRAGVVTVPAAPVSGSIPGAVGASDMVTPMHHQLRAGRVITQGSWADVDGVLRTTSAGGLEFYRSSAGSAVPSGVTDFASTFTGNASTAVFWFGGNDFTFGVKGQSASIADHVIGNYRKVVEWGTQTGRRVVICGTTTRDGTVAGSDEHKAIERINATLAYLYPDLYMPVQAYYSQRALADAGLSPTAEDTARMAAGLIPKRLYVDNAHFTPEAHKVIGEKFIAPWLAARGYARTSAALAAPDVYATSFENYLQGRNRTLDTGWRDVTALAVAGVVTEGEIRVRRTGPTVWVQFFKVQLESRENWQNIINLPTGFRPDMDTFNTQPLGVTSGTDRVSIYAVGALHLSGHQDNTGLINLALSFPTSSKFPEPANYPGSAA